MRLLCADGRTPLEVHGYAALFAPGPGERFRPGAFMLDRDTPLVVNHVGHHAPLANTEVGTLRIWEDRLGLAFAADVTTENAGAMLGYLGRGIGCSIAWDGAIKSGGVISACTLVDIALTDHPADRRACAWRNDMYWRDLPRAALALHSEFYKARDAAGLVDVRTIPVSAAASASPRPLARRSSEMTPRAAAAGRLRASAEPVDFFEICREIIQRNRARARA